MMLIHDDCRAVMPRILKNPKCIIVTDPPFNIGYHYRSYKDNLSETEYFGMLREVLCLPFVVILYPEIMYRLAIELGLAPDKVVSWVYNSNTKKQHRDIGFFGGVEYDFSKVKQPYKNPNDKRVRQLIANGSKGCNLYDWWNINQVKNVSKEKTAHPCQMPLEVMDRIIGVLPDDAVIVDPFMGSGTTGVAAAKLGREFIGIESDAEYFKIAQDRIGALNA